MLAARWLGLPPTSGALFALGTATVSILGWDRETAVVETWNEACHLDLKRCRRTKPPLIADTIGRPVRTVDGKQSHMVEVLMIGLHTTCSIWNQTHSRPDL